LGRNGAGKTTLIRLAMGLLHPQEGSCTSSGFADRSPGGGEETGRVCGRGPGAATQAVVDDVIEFHRRLFRSGTYHWKAALDTARHQAGRNDWQAEQGEARRVALLCAVCHKPELLILDEPAGGLDPAVRREFLEVAVQLLNREGTTILFSSTRWGPGADRLAGGAAG